MGGGDNFPGVESIPVSPVKSLLLNPAFFPPTHPQLQTINHAKAIRNPQHHPFRASNFQNDATENVRTGGGESEHHHCRSLSSSRESNFLHDGLPQSWLVLSHVLQPFFHHQPHARARQLHVVEGPPLVHFRQDIPIWHPVGLPDAEHGFRRHAEEGRNLGARSRAPFGTTSTNVSERDGKVFDGVGLVEANVRT